MDTVLSRLGISNENIRRGAERKGDKTELGKTGSSEVRPID